MIIITSMRRWLSSHGPNSESKCKFVGHISPCWFSRQKEWPVVRAWIWQLPVWRWIGRIKPRNFKSLWGDPRRSLHPIPRYSSEPTRSGRPDASDIGVLGDARASRLYPLNALSLANRDDNGVGGADWAWDWLDTVCSSAFWGGLFGAGSGNSIFIHNCIFVCPWST